MLFRIQDGCLWNTYLTIRIEDFIFLTGKAVDLNKREGKRIIVTRSQGHIRIADSEFILFEKYKLDGKTYKCVCIDKRGTACMEPEGKKLAMVVTSNPEKWEIV